MSNGNGANDGDNAVDLVVEYAAANRHDQQDLEAFLRSYFDHVDAGDLSQRSTQDLFGLAAEHIRLAADWSPGRTEMSILNPRVDVDGWQSEHTVVMIVTGDLPFLVGSVSMELTRLEIGIHLVVHPVLADGRATGDSFTEPPDSRADNTPLCSFIAVEIDRQLDPERIDEIEKNLRRVLNDVGAAVQDWAPMRARMAEIAAGLTDENLPLTQAEIEEGRELLAWLADNHFIFLGYREYRLDDEHLSTDLATGLGILRSDGTNPSPPRKLASMAPLAKARAREPVLLNITKAGSRSTVHRAAYMDYIGVKTFGEDGRVTGERRFLGLHTSDVYTRSVTRVPRVRRLVDEVVERAGYPRGGHDERRLLTILEAYPRDELLQIHVDELFETAKAIAGLQERRRVRIFARPEVFGRFVTCMVYLPRDLYNTATRSAIHELLIDAYGGSSADWSTQISESVLARILFHVRVESGYVAEVDVPELESRIEDLIRDWGDEFTQELVATSGESAGLALARKYAQAFPPDYCGAFPARTATADVAQLEQLGSDGELRLHAYREPGQPATSFKLKLYRQGKRVSLTSVMPSLTNLGVTVVDERPYQVRPAGQEPVWIYDFALEHPDQRLNFAQVSSLVEETFGAVWRGEVADDGFNRLVLDAFMGPREVGILRAYSRYLRQTGVANSQSYIIATLTNHPGAARMLVDLFLARFDPDQQDREATTASISDSFFALVDQIDSLDADRILRRFHNLIDSTLRTNCFQGSEDQHPQYLSFKLDPTSIDDLPEPRPQYEIFVYSPRFEGVHLRAGTVARGGLRWSDRNEDYRTEVLGLVKAQMVKNAVIVPAGAKGGFVLKRRPEDPALLRDEVVACYKLFVSGLLDLTDNLVDGEVVPPERTVRYDSDDTYMVVAADKGTATFSDIANGLAMDRGFWLGDAFASGGSHGYDHKGMGITARGAWESVKRHFRELGRDIQTEAFTAVGIGDMSGDVFGNGMMLSPYTRLVAAFDHRHIFVDPDPDAQTSLVERTRLFELPRSSWADYDQSLLSEGGGVYERTAKSVKLSDQARSALGIGAAELTPDALISAVLRAPVDLLWNGGIGTYIKSGDETHADVGDKANDTIRADASEIRAKVVGEGGNLGVTQRGRIEFARGDGRIYTDAIDNAAGVDCSDHEVNIKILLDEVVRAGELTDKQRNELLAEMTDEVSTLVLTNNYNQTQALGKARVEATSMVDVDTRYLAYLESRGLLDRQLEGLPDAEGMADRSQEGAGLTTPELAVVLAYTKNILSTQLLDSPIAEDEAFSGLLTDYFPTPLRDRYGDQIQDHRLRREIVSNRIANVVVDRAGSSMVYRLSQETSAPNHEIAAAHMAAWEIFGLDGLTRAVNDIEDVLPAEQQLAIHLSGRQLAERATRLLVRSRPYPFSAADAIADLAAPVQETIAHLPDYLAGSDRDTFESKVQELLEVPIPEDLARQVASLSPSLAALDIVEVAQLSGAPVPDVAVVHFGIADQLDLNWLRDRILALPRDSQWSSLARLTLRGDLYTDHRALTARVVGDNIGADSHQLLTDWLNTYEGPVGYYRRTISEIRSAGPTDLTTLLVASREVRSLITRTN